MADEPILLSELIAELRRELAKAQAQGQGLQPRLRIEEAEIELQVVITREDNAGIGVKFWVLNADIKDKRADATTQKIKLKLKPSDDFVIRAPEAQQPVTPDRREGGMRATE
jgi:Trypsin-co-occurring domain 2